MVSLMLFGALIILLILTVPVGVALAISSVLAILFSSSVPIEGLVRGLVTSLDTFPLLAVPLFILAGELMSGGGISERLMNFGKVVVGNLTGGLAIVAILTSMFFAAISGSGPATVAAVGGILIPAMVKEGYSKTFSTALIAASGSLGIIIPPSIPLIMYGVSSQTSIGNLFIGGIIPGILIGLGLILWTYIYSKKMGYRGMGDKFSFARFFKELNNAKWALLTPVIILGGIYSGLFTPTEAAVVAVVYSFIVSVFVYKELKLKQVPKIINDASITSAAIVIIISAASVFGKVLTLEQIPNKIATAFTGVSDSIIVIILLINLLLLIVGMFMDTAAAVVILTPILYPVAMQIGLDPVHFGIIMVVNLSIGFITPPLGMNLFVGSSISGIGVPTLARAAVPFLLIMLITLTIIALVPQLTLFLVG